MTDTLKKKFKYVGIVIEPDIFHKESMNYGKVVDANGNYLGHRVGSFRNYCEPYYLQHKKVADYQYKCRYHES